MKEFAAWLGKEAAALVRNTTSRSRRVPLSQAAEALKEEPPSSAQGHQPQRYGMPVKRSEKD